MAKRKVEFPGVTFYGVDFTSSPSRRKPITCVGGQLAGDVLRLDVAESFSNFEEFEKFLGRPGPWFAGMDFPFSLPRPFLEASGLGFSWPEVVSAIHDMGKPKFLQALKTYRDAHPPGQKQPLRETDKLAKACSPMMSHGVPVAQMFFEGAPRMLRSGANILPLRSGDPERNVFECYPALLVRKLHQGKYKSEIPGKDGDMSPARAAMLNTLALRAPELLGVSVILPEEIQQAAVADFRGDVMDALLCAAMTAWSFRNMETAIPPRACTLEGWIAGADGF